MTPVGGPDPLPGHGRPQQSTCGGETLANEVVVYNYLQGIFYSYDNVSTQCALLCMWFQA